MNGLHDVWSLKSPLKLDANKFHPNSIPKIEANGVPCLKNEDKLFVYVTFVNANGGRDALSLKSLAVDPDEERSEFLHFVLRDSINKDFNRYYSL